MFFDRLVFSLLAGFLGTQPYCPYLLLGWTLLYTIFVAVTKPYEKRHHYFRGLATQSAATVILALYCVLAGVADEMYLTCFRIIAILVLVILLLNLLGNLTFIAMAIRKEINARKKSGIEENEQSKKELKQMEMDLLRNMKERLDSTQRGNSSLNETMWRKNSL